MLPLRNTFAKHCKIIIRPGAWQVYVWITRPPNTGPWWSLYITVKLELTQNNMYSFLNFAQSGRTVAWSNLQNEISCLKNLSKDHHIDLLLFFFNKVVFNAFQPLISQMFLKINAFLSFKIIVFLLKVLPLTFYLPISKSKLFYHCELIFIYFKSFFPVTNYNNICKEFVTKTSRYCL